MTRASQHQIMFLSNLLTTELRFSWTTSTFIGVYELHDSNLSGRHVISLGQRLRGRAVPSNAWHSVEQLARVSAPLYNVNVMNCVCAFEMNVISLNFESQKLTYYNMTMALYVFLVTGDTRRRRQRQPGFYRTAV